MCEEAAKAVELADHIIKTQDQDIKNLKLALAQMAARIKNMAREGLEQERKKQK